MVRLISITLFMIGAIVLATQVLYFLHDGVWVPVSLLDGIKYIDPDWVANPSSWVGLHQVFGATPASVFAIGAGAAVPLIAFASFCAFSRANY